MIYRILGSDHQFNLLLFGSPLSAKSLFVSIIKEQCNNVFYFDASTKSSAKMFDELSNYRDSKVIIIDEIDKLKIPSYNSITGLLKNGRVAKLVRNKHIDLKFDNCTIIATATNIEKLDEEIRSLFFPYRLPEYSNEEFKDTIKHYFQDILLLENSEMIVDELLAHGVNDVKAALTIGQSLSNDDSIDEIERTIGNFIRDYKLKQKKKSRPSKTLAT
jgi:Holliday junction resolvasome RuvABC ATP-dependent DNA helicase subunit